MSERDLFGKIAKSVRSTIERRRGSLREKPLERVVLPAGAPRIVSLYHDTLLQVVGLRSIEVTDASAGNGKCIARVVPLPALETAA